MKTNEFWKPRPKEPKDDVMVKALLYPTILSVLGFAIVGVFAFAFDAIDIIPKKFQDWLTIIGSVLVVLSAEGNTPGTFVEYFRKERKGEVINKWDKFALIASSIGTGANILVVFAIAIIKSAIFSGNAPWMQWVLDWGPLASALAVVCDYVGALIELGFLIGSYEQRMEKWLDEKHEYDVEQMSTVDNSEFQPVIDTFQETVNKLLSTVNKLQNDVEYLQYPVADLQWFKAQVSSNNGHFAQYKEMNALDAVKEICRVGGRRFDSTPRTANNWHKELTK